MAVSTLLRTLTRVLTAAFGLGSSMFFRSGVWRSAPCPAMRPDASPSDVSPVADGQAPDGPGEIAERLPLVHVGRGGGEPAHRAVQGHDHMPAQAVIMLAPRRAAAPGGVLRQHPAPPRPDVAAQRHRNPVDDVRPLRGREQPPQDELLHAHRFAHCFANVLYDARPGNHSLQCPSK